METRVIENFGTVTSLNIGNKTLNKYLVKWVKDDGRQRHISRIRTMFAENLEHVKKKCIVIYGEYPAYIRRI